MYKIFIKDQRLYVVLVINKDVVFKGIVGCMMCDEGNKSVARALVGMSVTLLIQRKKE